MASNNQDDEIIDPCFGKPKEFFTLEFNEAAN